MPRNNKSGRRQQQSKPWSGTPTRSHRRDADREDSRQIRRGRSRKDRQLSVRSELRREPDVRRIARAVIELAMAQAEADAANATASGSSSSRSSEASS